MRVAFRSLARTPGFSAVIVLTLALGIGANTAIFSFFRGILLRPLPLHEPERVVALKKQANDFGEPAGVEVGLLAADFRELAPRTRTLAEVAAYTLDSATLTGRGPADLIAATIVTPNFFSMLGTRAAIGRTFTAAESSETGGRLATVSHAYWRDHFGGDPEVLGRSVILNQVPFTIVGVMPPDFEFPREADFWVTPASDVPEAAIGLEDDDFRGRGNYLRTVLGRLAPGVTMTQAEQELASLITQLPNPNEVQRSVHLVNMRDQTVGNVRPALMILLGCVGLVLLIACLNVANLMLSRATARDREIGIRLALGASRWRMGWTLSSESLVLSLLGGGAGLLLSLWLLDLLVALAPAEIPLLAAVHVDGWVLGFALVLSVVTGLICGLAPIVGAARSDVVTSIKSGDRGTTGGAPRRLRAVLVGSEVAISVVLLVAAGLLLRSFANMQAFSWGIDSTRLMTARVAFLEERYATDEARIRFYRTLVEKLEPAPGIEAVGMSLDRIGNSWVHLPFVAQGEVYPNPNDRPQANYHFVTPGYLRTMGIALLQGREFTLQDDLEHPPVAIIDADLARRHFPQGDAVGRTVALAGRTGEIAALIVGIASPVTSDGPLGVPRPDIYIPFLQVPVNNFFVHVRTSLQPAAAAELIRGTVHAMDPDVPVSEVAAMNEVVNRPAVARRFQLGLFVGFAGIALVLASVGIYAVTTYSVTQRTREIGVRMALGAEANSVVRLVLRQSFRPILTGLMAGLAGAIAVGLLMRQLLFGISPLDAPTLVIVPLLLVGIALLACLAPARRATRVDPLVALRSE